RSRGRRNHANPGGRRMPRLQGSRRRPGPRWRSTVMVRSRSRLVGAAGGNFGILLVALIALLATAPLILAARAGNIALGLFAYAVLIASLHAARPGGRAVAIGLVLALVDFGIGRLAALDTFKSARWLVFLQVLLWLSILIFVTVAILEAIFASDRVSVETLQASLCVYMLLGLIWVFLFALID